MTPSHCSVNRSWYFSIIFFIFWEGLEASVTTESHHYKGNILQSTLSNLNNFKITYLGGFRSSLDFMVFEIYIWLLKLKQLWHFQSKTGMPIWKVSFIMNRDYLVDRLRTQRKRLNTLKKGWRTESQYCSYGSVAEAQRGCKWVDKLSFQSPDFRKEDSKTTSSLQEI